MAAKNEIALMLAASIIILLLSSVAIGIGTGFVYGDVKIDQDHFDQIFQFGILFAGAAMMYFGFRAGQANGNSVGQG